MKHKMLLVPVSSDPSMKEPTLAWDVGTRSRTLAWNWSHRTPGVVAPIPYDSKP